MPSRENVLSEAGVDLTQTALIPYWALAVQHFTTGTIPAHETNYNITRHGIIQPTLSSADKR